MKTLLLLPAAGVVLFASSCRTVYPLCPMTMTPTSRAGVAVYPSQPCPFRQDDPRVCSPSRVRVIATK